MSIKDYLDGYQSIKKFDTAYTGPGVYVLFDGRSPKDENIVYIGKSDVEIVMRVKAHKRDKDFTHVGMILPHNTGQHIIHNLEAMLIQDYESDYDELPYFNQRRENLLPGTRRFNWRKMKRRRGHLLFSYAEDEEEFEEVEDPGRLQGGLRRAWTGFRIARGQDDYDSMLQYSEAINHFQRLLGLDETDFDF